MDLAAWLALAEGLPAFLLPVFMLVIVLEGVAILQIVIVAESVACALRTIVIQQQCVRTLGVGLLLSGHFVDVSWMKDCRPL